MTIVIWRRNKYLKTTKNETLKHSYFSRQYKGYMFLYMVMSIGAMQLRRHYVRRFINL